MYSPPLLATLTNVTPARPTTDIAATVGMPEPTLQDSKTAGAGRRKANVIEETDAL